MKRVLVRLFVGIPLAVALFAPPTHSQDCTYRGRRCSAVVNCDVCAADVFWFRCPDGSIDEIPTGGCCSCI